MGVQKSRKSIRFTKYSLKQKNLQILSSAKKTKYFQNKIFTTKRNETVFLFF